MKINFFSNNFNQCRFIIFFDKGFCNLKGGENKSIMDPKKSYAYDLHSGFQFTTDLF